MSPATNVCARQVLDIGEACDPRAEGLCISVARDIEAIMHAFAVRTVVYVCEQACPYAEEFDGNDFAAATHFVAKLDGEPIGTLRLRWFARFVKVERVAVKRDARGIGIATALVEDAILMAQRRGYETALAYIQVRLIPFWRSLGFLPRAERPRFRFSDYDYVEACRSLDRLPGALSIDSDPFVLMRPEGLWDHPGVLDRSSVRLPWGDAG